METAIKRPTYLERKRQAILELGYDYVKFRSRTKKSLKILKKLYKTTPVILRKSTTKIMFYGHHQKMTWYQKYKS